MPHDHAPASEAAPPIYSRPWPLLGAGLVLVLLASAQPSLWKNAPDGVAGLGRFLVLVAGGLLLSIAVVFRLRRADWELPGRIESAAMVSLCGLAALFCYGTLIPTLPKPPDISQAWKDWVSGKVLLAAISILCLAGAILILLPSIARRVALSLILLFHFGGLATAVTVVDPPGDTGPWLSKQLWFRVYRPYLSFLYLTNAYHFYSPNPGPPALFWFAVQYDDGSYTWYKVPDRANSPIGMHYQRMLALPEHSFAALPRLPVTDEELEVLRVREKLAGKPSSLNLPRGTWQDIIKRRYDASLQKVQYALRDEPGKGLPIPFIQDQDMNWSLQYREPTDYSKDILASVARRALMEAPPPPREGVKVRSVKMYRVVANLLSPAELAAGMHPLEKTKHWGYYLGEFSPEGILLDPLDPFLYWYLPIVYVHKSYPNDSLSLSRKDRPHPRSAPTPVPSLMPFASAPAKDDRFLLDCVELHAAGRLHKKETK